MVWGLEGYVEGGGQYQAQGLVCQGSLEGVGVKTQSTNGSLQRVCCSCQQAIVLAASQYSQLCSCQMLSGLSWQVLWINDQLTSLALHAVHL